MNGLRVFLKGILGPRGCRNLERQVVVEKERVRVFVWKVLEQEQDI